MIILNQIFDRIALLGHIHASKPSVTALNRKVIIRCREQTYKLLNLILCQRSYIFHNSAKAALQNDGWTVTEPLYLRLGDDQLRIDWSSERLIAAERAQEKIAVEVKSFVGASAIADFHTAPLAISQL